MHGVQRTQRMYHTSNLRRRRQQNTRRQLQGGRCGAAAMQVDYEKSDGASGGQPGGKRRRAANVTARPCKRPAPQGKTSAAAAAAAAGRCTPALAAPPYRRCLGSAGCQVTGTGLGGRRALARPSAAPRAPLPALARASRGACASSSASGHPKSTTCVSSTSLRNLPQLNSRVFGDSRPLFAVFYSSNDRASRASHGHIS